MIESGSDAIDNEYVYGQVVFLTTQHSVSPSFITVTCGEKFTGSNTSGNYINLSKRYELVGDGFTLSNSGVVCNFNGYVAASMSAYIRGGANSTVQIYLHQNEADVLSVAREADGNAQLTMSPFTLRVKNGDLIRLSGRTWDDVGSFTLRANTMTYMTLQKIIATSQQPICRIIHRHI